MHPPRPVVTPRQRLGRGDRDAVVAGVVDVIVGVRPDGAGAPPGWIAVGDDAAV